MGCRWSDAVVLVQPGVQRAGEDGLDVFAVVQVLGDPGEGVGVEGSSLCPVAPGAQRREVAVRFVAVLFGALSVVGAVRGVAVQPVAFDVESVAFFDGGRRGILGELKVPLGDVDIRGGALVVAAGAAPVESTG